MAKTHITVCKSSMPGKNFCKIDGQSFGFPYLVTLRTQEIELDPLTFLNVYRQMAAQPAFCRLYGSALYPEMKDVQRTNKNLAEVPVNEIVFDLDGVDVPGSQIERAKNDHLVEDHISNDIDTWICTHLPPEFHNATYIRRLSSSFLSKPGLRVHLHFYIEHALYPSDIKNWIAAREIPTDKAIFRLTQPLYTAGPQFVELQDPLANHPEVERLRLIKKPKDIITEKWFPLDQLGVKDKTDYLKTVPDSASLAGEAGAFNRKHTVQDILTDLGYEETEPDRWLSPSSDTGSPGVIVFDNGYVYSHHSGDIIEEIKDRVYFGRKEAFHAYELSRGYAHLYRGEAQTKYLNQLQVAMEDDDVFAKNTHKELSTRLQWLEKSEGYSGFNKLLIRQILEDIVTERVSDLVISELLIEINVKTGKRVGLTDLKKELKRIKSQFGLNQDEKITIDADPAHNADLMWKRNILYPDGDRTSGYFFIYTPETSMWKRLSGDGTLSALEDQFNAELQEKIYFTFKQSIELATKLKRKAVQHGDTFRPGDIIAFKGGRIGISLEDWRTKGWNPDKAVKTIVKEDHCCRELPITFEEWRDSKDKVPEMFMHYLMSTFPDDDTRILFMEIAAYIMESSYYHTKFFIFEGGPGTGKSAAVRLINALIGDNNSVALKLDNFGYQFGLAALVGKKLIQLNEPRQMDFNKRGSALEALLAITGQDKMDIQVKRSGAISTILPGKILMVTNQMPRFDDESGALAERMVLIRFNKKFRDTEENISKIDDIMVKSELPMIIRACLNKLVPLHKEGGFRVNEAQKAALEKIEMSNSPMRSFIMKNFDIEPGANPATMVRLSEFKGWYMMFAKGLGIDMDESKIGYRTQPAALQAIHYQITKKKIRYSGESKTGLWPLVPKDRVELDTLYSPLGEYAKQ